MRNRQVDCAGLLNARMQQGQALDVQIRKQLAGIGFEV